MTVYQFSRSKTLSVPVFTMKQLFYRCLYSPLSALLLRCSITNNDRTDYCSTRAKLPGLSQEEKMPEDSAQLPAR